MREREAGAARVVALVPDGKCYPRIDAGMQSSEMGKIDAVPDVGHVGKDIENALSELFSRADELAVANPDPG
jgi:hypothetical protein